MTTNADAPRQDRGDRKLRTAVLLLGLVMVLIITAAAVYVARVHPSLAEPLSAGAAVLGALVGTAAMVSRLVR